MAWIVSPASRSATRTAWASPLGRNGGSPCPSTRGTGRRVGRRRTRRGGRSAARWRRAASGSGPGDAPVGVGRRPVRHRYRRRCRSEPCDPVTSREAAASISPWLRPSPTLGVDRQTIDAARLLSRAAVFSGVSASCLAELAGQAVTRYLEAGRPPVPGGRARHQRCTCWARGGSGSTSPAPTARSRRWPCCRPPPPSGSCRCSTAARARRRPWRSSPRWSSAWPAPSCGGPTGPTPTWPSACCAAWPRWSARPPTSARRWCSTTWPRGWRAGCWPRRNATATAGPTCRPTAAAPALAAEIGGSEAGVRRILRSFELDGLISSDGAGFRILDPATLAARAGA